MIDKEVKDTIATQILQQDDVTIHQVSVLFEMALDRVKSKKDLTDGERETIKNVRSMIKGL